MKQTLNSSADLATSTQIMDFINPVEYLRSYYENRKSQDSGFSYGDWAAEAGIKSRSFLRLVLVGKRSLTLDVAEKLSNQLPLSSQEKKYFLQIVKMQRATQHSTKERLTNEALKLRRRFALKTHDFIELQKTQIFDFLSSYKMPRLQVLLSTLKSKKTAIHMAELLNSKPQELEAQLQTLKDLGLAQKSENQEWYSTNKAINLKDSLGHIALQSFHRKSLEEAIAAIEMPVETRRYQSLVLALTEKEFAELFSEMRTKLEEIMALQNERLEAENENPTFEAKKIYQLNLNLIPVSRPILQSESPAPVERDENTKGQIK